MAPVKSESLALSRNLFVAAAQEFVFLRRGSCTLASSGLREETFGSTCAAENLMMKYSSSSAIFGTTGKTDIQKSEVLRQKN
jgi:hypothetical protein